MDIDPHTLQQILQRIHQQMRCPQCGRKIPVDFSSVRVVSGEGLLLQIKCEGCNAFVVLHACVQGTEKLGVQVREDDESMVNASSALGKSEEEVKVIRTTLEKGMSFETMFKKAEKAGPDTEIA